MADLKDTAVEKLNGPAREYKVNEGASASQTPGEYDWGTGEDGAYTYADVVRDGVFMVYDATADFRVKRAGAGAQGKTLIGIAYGVPQGKAGQEREVRIKHFDYWDVVRCIASGAIAIGDKVSLSGAYSAAVEHGFKVAADNVNGFGYALNATAADGEAVAIQIRPGTY